MNLESIDWALLRTQKEWLLRQRSPEADGLVSLIDSIQDAATMDGDIDEELVYGPDLEPNTVRPTVTYTLPAHWALYLINGDPSFFSVQENGDDELRQIDQLMADYGVAGCLDSSDEAFFTKTHDAPLTPACMCLEYTFEEIET